MGAGNVRWYLIHGIPTQMNLLAQTTAAQTEDELTSINAIAHQLKSETYA